jgi:hypothetical protein
VWRVAKKTTLMTLCCHFFDGAVTRPVRASMMKLRSGSAKEHIPRDFLGWAFVSRRALWSRISDQRPFSLMVSAQSILPW